MLKEALKRTFVVQRGGPRPPEPGLHPFTREAEGRQVRYHLRVDADGAGLLLADASRALRLSPVGVAAAAGLLGGVAPAALATRLKRQFRGATRGRLEADVAKVDAAIRALARPGHDGPVDSLDDPTATARTRALSAPMCADLRLCPPEVGEPVLRRLWDAGVPQVVLAVPPGGDTGALMRLVELAGDLGLITGVRGRATDLAAEGLLASLAEAGLDHLDLAFAGEAEAHDALFGDGDHAAAAGLFVAAGQLEVFALAVVPLVEATAHDLEAVLAAARALGAGAAVAHAVVQPEGATRALHPAALRQAAASCEAAADALGLKVVFATPTAIDTDAELEEAVGAGPRGAGEGTLAVDAAGRVLPPRGDATAVGDLTAGDLAGIWAADCFTPWREATEPPERCDACPGLATCDAGCPSAPATWAHHGGGAS